MHNLICDGASLRATLFGPGLEWERCCSDIFAIRTYHDA